MTNATCARASDTPTGGYFAHRRRGEPPCADCTRKFVEHNNAYRRSNGRNDRRHEVTCEHCGETKLVTKKSARFCSSECYAASRAKGAAAKSTRSRRWWAAYWRLRRASNRAPRIHTVAVWYVDSSGACSSSLADLTGRRRFKIGRARRLAIYERDEWLCQLCGDPVDATLDPLDEWAATLDHIVPRSHGGGDDDGNLRLAHRWCNSVRGDGRYYTVADLAA